jgi:hypothetical protein
MAVINGEYFWPLTASKTNKVEAITMAPTQFVALCNCAPCNKSQQTYKVSERTGIREATPVLVFACDDSEVLSYANLRMAPEERC